MIVFLNGQFIPAEEAKVSIFDRSFLYGDGLFETLRVYQGQPFRWVQHWKRLEQGAKLLRIQLPFSSREMQGISRLLVEKNQMPESILRINVSRGVGNRGYSIKGAANPLFIMTVHPAVAVDAENVPAVSVITSSLRVIKNDPLAAIKSCNKLVQIIARAEAEQKGAAEALLLNDDGEVAETTAANVFWIEGRKVHTPPIDTGLLPGVTRSLVIELCRKRKLPFAEKSITPDKLRKTDGVFLTLSTAEILEVSSLDGKKLARSPLVKNIALAYRDLARKETRLSL